MTRIAVLSDSHGDHESLQNLLLKMGSVDVICFLGDIERDSDYLEALNAVSPNPAVLWVVKGNNDLASTLPTELLFEAEGNRIFITHGHLYHVRSGVDHLVARAKALDARIALYGHTHEPYCAWEHGVLVINPGAAGRSWRNAKARGILLLIDQDRIRVQDIEL